LVSAHARARLRGFAGKKDAKTARVEFVGGSSTPSVYDIVARDAYLTILWTAALEAVAHGKTPQEYFGQCFPSVTQWQNQPELAMSYSTRGLKDGRVQKLVAENIQFLFYLKETHPHLGKYINYVLSRLNNMGKTATAENVDEYTKHPQGNIADVIVRMKKNGYSDVEILRQLNDHQISAAQNVIACGGDYQVLLAQVTGHR
jgi:hypothetical protein